MGWDCTADSPGFQVQCQMDSKEESYYGDACIVAHTGKTLYMKLWFSESCIIKLPDPVSFICYFQIISG